MSVTCQASQTRQNNQDRRDRLVESLFYINKTPIACGTCSTVMMAYRWPCRYDDTPKNKNKHKKVCLEHSDKYSWICDIPMDQHLSIKVLSNTFNLDEKAYFDLVVSEIDILEYLAKYEKPNINLPTFYGTVKNKAGNLCIVSRKEFKTLRQILTGINSEYRFQFTTTKIKHTQFLSVFAGILSGLYGLHFNKIIHRDLKPANIMFSHEGNIIVIDMGMSCWNFSNVSELKSENGTDVVTSFYRAPEITLKQKYSFSTDIWSLAICMLDLALGEPIMYTYDRSERFPDVSDDILKVFRHQAVLEIFTNAKNSAEHYKKVVKPTKHDNDTSEYVYNILIQETKNRAKSAKACLTDLIFSEHPGTGKDFLKLLSQMLSVDPEKRPTSKELLKSNLLKKLVSKK